MALAGTLSSNGLGRSGAIAVSLAIVALATSVLSAGCAHAADSGVPVVRFIAIESWGDPMGHFERERLVSGLNYDLARLIAKRAGVSAEFVTLSRNRADEAIERGQVDVRCNSNPEWVTNPHAYLWSADLFQINDLIVWRIGNAPIASLDDLRGKTVTAVLGYRYPPLQSLFDTGSVMREDAPSQDQVLHMLGLGRASYALTNSISLGFYLRNNPTVIGIERANFAFDHVGYRCGVRRDGSPVLQRVLAAIGELAGSRELAQLLAAYQ